MGGGRGAGERNVLSVLSCLLDTWSVALVNHFAEAISTPVREPWHLIGTARGPCTEADNGWHWCVSETHLHFLEDCQ